jgi:hypothetical protein
VSSSAGGSSSGASTPRSYLSLWYQDLQREGTVGERTKLDMRVSRWLASLGEAAASSASAALTPPSLATTASLTTVPTVKRPYLTLQHASSVPLVRTMALHPHSGLCSVYA